MWLASSRSKCATVSGCAKMAIASILLLVFVFVCVVLRGVSFKFYMPHM